MNEDERNAMIEEYGRGFELLSAAISEVPRRTWKFKPAPSEWSVHEILVHMADSESIGVNRLHKLIAEPGSTLMPYEEGKWAEALDYQNQDVDDALEIFKLIRRTTYRLLKTLPDQVFLHSVAHPLWDEPYTLEKWLVIYTRHVREHVEQLKKGHQAWKDQNG
jgi:hypothetical protein